MNDDAALRAAIVKASRGMLEAGLTRGTSGNVSARSGAGMLITPSAVPYAELEPELLVYVPFSEAPAVLAPAGDRRASTEWRLHAAILHARQDIHAVLHAHPPYSSALASLRRDIPAFHYMVAIAGGTDIRCARYATFGTPELAACALDALKDRSACLLANHGTITLGITPEHALELAIEVEALAEMYCHALACGEPVVLSRDEMAAVLERFREYRRVYQS